VLFLEGALRTPIDGGLRHTVRTVLRSGQRVIVLDLTGVPSIDAAGVGELVRAYNMTGAAQGVLRIVQATARVQRILERAGLFGVLSAGRSRVQLASC
jgi:anti-anti-sigma factor